MWRYWPGRSKAGEEVKGQNEEEGQLNYRQLKKDIQEHLVKLSQEHSRFQDTFKQHYGVSQHEITVTNTFNQLITTIQGLLAIIGQLKGEFDAMQKEVIEGKRAKNMLNNHQNTISDIQESHSQQVYQIYEEKRIKEEEMNGIVQQINQKNKELETNLEQVMAKVTDLYERNNLLQMQITNLASQKQQLTQHLSQIEKRYSALVNPVQKIPQKKIIDIDNIKLQYLFYYSKMKEKILGYLNIKDILNLQRTNKFYHHLLKKQQGVKLNQYFKRQYQKKINNEIESAKLYQKIYQLFPLENIKINAFKYLYFRIKPATYILPFLQEQQVQINKKQHQDSREKQNAKFNWKFWGSEKKIQKKEDKENKFNLTSLKNQEQFKRTQQKIQATFKNILHVNMPDDLKYFSDNMERQLQQLKVDLVQSKQGKTGQMQWTSQLYCLSRYMYHQINQLFNLVQVIFGQLVKKNKDLIKMTQEYEYLKQNELVLRNLIQNLSGDKSTIEKKYLLIQNQILKKNLEKETVINQMDKLMHSHQQLENQFQQLHQDHIHCHQTIEKLAEGRKKVQGKFHLIREELDALQKLPTKIRKSSIGSVSSEEHPVNDVLNQ